jgi:hypothetical protein
LWVASAIRLGDQIYRKLDRNPFNSRTVSPRTMSRVIFARLSASDDPRSELTWYQFQRLVRQSEAPPIRIAETCRIGVSGCPVCLAGVLCLAAVKGRARPLSGARHVPQWGADASPSASPPHRPVRTWIPGGSGSSAAVMSAVATMRYPRLAIASGQATRWKSAVDGREKAAHRQGSTLATAQVKAYYPGGLPR